METVDPNLDALNVSVMRLWREVHTEKEYCKNLENLYKTLESDITRIQKINTENKEKTNEVHRKYGLLQNSVQSTRKSIGLVNELLCDLKKQLYLERMTTNEKSSRYKETIARYESIWENYQAIYMTFPKAKEVRDLRVAVKLDGIKLASRRVEMGDLRKKIKTLQEVTDKQNTCMTVEVAELMLKRMACAAKREMLQKNLRELKAEVTLLKKEKTQMLESLVVRGKAAAAATAVAPAGLSAVQKSPGLTPVTSHTQPHVRQREAITPERATQKRLLFSPLELPMIRLPVLKLPVFNSPPRKIPRSHPADTSAIIRNLNAILNPVEPPKEVDHIPPASDVPSGEEARDNTTLVDLTCSLPCNTEDSNAPEQTSDFHSEPDTFPEEQSESNTIDNAPISEIQFQEKRLDLNSSQTSDCDAAVVEDNNDEMDHIESPSPTQPSSEGILDEEILNDEARKDYLYRLKQSPELNFIARTNYVEAWDPNDKNANRMPSDEAYSPYFAHKGANAGDQSQKISDVGSNYDEGSIRSCDADEGESVPDSVNAILAKYGHSALSSPNGSINLEDEINLQTNQISGGGDASGTFFSFGRTSNQNSIRSLFGGGDSGPSNEACLGSSSEGTEGQKKTNNTFSFSFEKKTTANNFFKLFN